MSRLHDSHTSVVGALDVADYLLVAELHPETATKAAILCSRLVRHHPLPDGNERIAHICMREFIARDDIHPQRPSDDEAAEMIERLASRGISDNELNYGKSIPRLDYDSI